MRELTPKIALAAVSKYYNIPEELILRRCRRAEIVMPRHMGMSICYENVLPPGEIAKAFNTHRTMPAKAWWKIEKQCRAVPGIRNDRDKIRKLLTDGRKKVIQANTSSVLSDT